jgi:hypothetical protein
MSEQEDKNSGLAITSLVLGILTIVCGLLASIPCIIVSHLALSDLKKNEHLKGKGFAIFGLIAGYGMTVIFIISLLSLQYFGNAIRETMKQSTLEMQNTEHIQFE